MVSLPQMTTGVKISGVAHLGLILWAIFGGLFSFERDAVLEISDVTLISGEQFAAMMAAGSQAPDVSEAPVTPEAADRPEAPVPETPSPETAPEAAQTPDSTDAPAPEPEPEVNETFETPRAEVTPIAPTAPEQPDLPDGASSVFAPENPPAPDAAPRVAPRPAERPDPDANVAEEAQQAARREESPEAPPVPDAPEETTAPEETGTVIETEATEEAGGNALSDLAPLGAPRPIRRPNRPAPTQTAQPADEPEPASDPLADAIAGAVAEAAASSSSAQGQGTARTGPPLTSGEKDKLRIAVEQCWNVGSLSSDALRTTVTLYVLMNEDGTPDNGTIRMLGFDGGSEAAARQAYEAARRAVIRCGSRGFDLPAEKYGQWREIEMVFNPENMRIR